MEKAPPPCHFGKSCYKPDCRYAHPIDRNINPPTGDYQSKSTKECRNGNYCKTNNCRFLHPKDIQPHHQIPCRYGKNCKKENCNFGHENKRGNIDRPICTHGNNCSRENCIFRHPNDRVIPVFILADGPDRRNGEELTNERDHNKFPKKFGNLADGEHNKNFRSTFQSPIQPVPQFRSFSDKNDETNSRKDDSLAFWWFWQKNSGSFQPYDEQTNLMIEKEFTLYDEGKRDCKFITQAIIRFLDHVPQAYCIDFQNNIQINMKTKFQRKVKREKFEIPKIDNVWQFEYEQNIWKSFDMFVQGQIEQAFKTYRQSKSENLLKGLHIPGNSCRYTIDFANLIQINEKSHNKRKIRKFQK